MENEQAVEKIQENQAVENVENLESEAKSEGRQSDKESQFDDSALKKEIKALRDELSRAQVANLLNERRLVPHDRALVERLVLERGGDLGAAITNLYADSPYLFKSTSRQQADQAERDAQRERQDADNNKRFIDAVVTRLGRDSVSLC